MEKSANRLGHSPENSGDLGSQQASLRPHGKPENHNREHVATGSRKADGCSATNPAIIQDTSRGYTVGWCHCGNAAGVKIWTAATVDTECSDDSEPIGLVVAAIAALTPVSSGHIRMSNGSVMRFMRYGMDQEQLALFLTILTGQSGGRLGDHVALGQD